jgi:hypothetical protein
VWLQKLKDGLVPSEVRSPLIALDEPDNQKLKDGLVFRGAPTTARYRECP